MSNEAVRKKIEMARHQVALIDKMKKPYILAKRYDWKGFGKFFRKNKHLLDKQIDLHRCTPFHYAAHCGDPKMYEEMLEWVDEAEVKRVLRLQDDMGNTPLHEVAFTGEVEMTKSILKYDGEDSNQYQRLLEMRNNLGETPIYRAAALGKTDLLCYFLQEHAVDPNLHFHRLADKMSILHTAVIDQFFENEVGKLLILNTGTALWILKRHGDLAYEKEDNGLTTLQLLAKMPSIFKSQTQMGPLKNFCFRIIKMINTTIKIRNARQKRKIWKVEVTKEINHLQLKRSSGRAKMNHPRLKGNSQPKVQVHDTFLQTKKWKEIDKLWRKKEMHNLAKELVYLLAKNDYSWRNTAIARDRTVSMGSSQPEEKNKEKKDEVEEQKKQERAGKPTYTPLLMAACNGITEIVEVIIHLHPHSIEHVSDDEQNILYMAVKHRQKEIYQILKKLKMVRSLAGKIDKESNTVLHYTAEFQGGAQPGYAMQLQEELHWFDRIQKRLPYHYTIHKNQDNKTARELFVEKHGALLKDAREWIKETAQSCSAVAVLVATVVFAAAYTVPGGTDDDGFPRFLHNPIFLVFTIMDIVALVSSLASVIMFLSILTSPCEMWDFRKSLPRKLMAGFALLFFSMATTMLSFSATILININLEKNRWTSSLTYSAAFFPVCIFAIVQFPLFVAAKGCVQSIRRNLKKIIPRFLLKLVKRRKKLWDI
ncbi:Ankyrin repeat-containing protein NPR4, partial [Mucuna pruriens]